MNSVQCQEPYCEANWRKASYSASNASCVEVAVSPQGVGVRDTKDRDGGTLRINPAQWANFVAQLKDTP